MECAGALNYALQCADDKRGWEIDTRRGAVIRAAIVGDMGEQGRGRGEGRGGKYTPARE